MRAPASTDQAHHDSTHTSYRMQCQRREGGLEVCKPESATVQAIPSRSYFWQKTVRRLRFL